MCRNVQKRCSQKEGPAIEGTVRRARIRLEARRTVEAGYSEYANDHDDTFDRPREISEEELSYISVSLVLSYTTKETNRCDTLPMS